MTDLYGLARPLISILPTETAHRLAIRALKTGLVSVRSARKRTGDDGVLHQRLWGIDFPNPLGLAAGFDKNAEVVDPMLACGFGFVEIGGVTPRPQPGNPRPRLFRLAEDHAVINRMGFNNDGLAAIAGRLRHRRANPGIVAANIGKNKDSEDALADYVACLRGLAGLIDLVVVNVSSPNTPGLRALQGRDVLADLLDGLIAARDEAAPAAGPGATPALPLLVKIAPDLDDGEVADIVEVALDKRVDGLVVSNTTVARPQGLRSRARTEQGGLSGQPLFAPSTDLLRRVYRLSDGGCHWLAWVASARPSRPTPRIRAGASLVQLYTALVYRGPALVGEILDGLAALLVRDGFTNVGEAVGVDIGVPR